MEVANFGYFVASSVISIGTAVGSLIVYVNRTVDGLRREQEERLNSLRIEREAKTEAVFAKLLEGMREIRTEMSHLRSKEECGLLHSAIDAKLMTLPAQIAASVDFRAAIRHEVANGLMKMQSLEKREL